MHQENPFETLRARNLLLWLLLRLPIWIFLAVLTDIHMDFKKNPELLLLKGGNCHVS
jgi:hypothetical protein